jgi:hypothetical protein
VTVCKRAVANTTRAEIVAQVPRALPVVIDRELRIAGRVDKNAIGYRIAAPIARQM